MSYPLALEMKHLLTALQRLEDPNDPAAKALLEGGYITVNPDGIELTPKGELELKIFRRPSLADEEFERVVLRDQNQDSVDLRAAPINLPKTSSSSAR